MRLKYLIIAFLLILVAGLAFFYFLNFNKSMFRIYSPAFAEGKMIPEKYTCDSDNIIPPLVFENVPMGAKSIVLILNDPDSSGGNFNHWLVWNIDPESKEIKEGTEPTNANQGLNDFGKIGYGGPCPSEGTHRYVFTAYVLDKILALSSGASKTELEKEMAGHILAKAAFMGQYVKIQNR